MYYYLLQTQRRNVPWGMIELLAHTFIAAILTTAKLWKQPDAPQVMNGLKNEVYIQNRVLFTNKEE
jgi:hypothetical protein